MTATSAEQCVAFDGLIQPDKIPGAASSDNSGGQLNAAAITDACVQIRGVASKVRAGVTDVSSAWTPLPAAFVMPGAEPVHNAMAAPGTALNTFASTMDQMARALEDFAAEIEPLRRSFDEVRGRAQEFVDSLEPGNRVWMRASSTTAYQWDGNAVAHATGSYTYGATSTGADAYSVYDAASYLRGRGETARVSGGSVEILVSWLESGEHVGRNNDLMDEVADLYARLHAAEVDCANRINALREDVCLAPLEAVEAWQLKQDGVELPWGAKVEEERNCGEQVGHGFYQFGKGTVEGLGSLISYNPMKGEWGDWDHAGQSWAGIGDVVVSISTLGGGAIGMINVAINGPSAYTDSLETVTEVGKSLIAWDTWEDAPAQALTESILNIGTAFIPVGGWAAAGAKGLSAAAGATRITAALTKLERLGPAVMARLLPDSFRIDVDTPRIDIDAPTVRVDADAPTLRPDVDAPRIDADSPSTPGGGAVDDAARAGDDARPSDGPGRADDAPSTAGGAAADDGARAGGDGAAHGPSGAVDSEPHPLELGRPSVEDAERYLKEHGLWQEPGTRPTYLAEKDWGATLMSESIFDQHYRGNPSATLGPEGGTAWWMPAQDTVKIANTADAALGTGHAPTIETAARAGQDVIAVFSPIRHMDPLVPPANAGGANAHFLPGGHTASLSSDGATISIIDIHEFVTRGGAPVPPGSIVMRLSESGWSYEGLFHDGP